MNVSLWMIKKSLPDIFIFNYIYWEAIILKTRAELLINGVYRRITIWDALDWKRNRPDLWETYKDNLYSINKNPDYKVRMVFQTGRNNHLHKSYFRYKEADFEHRGEGSEESYRHEFFKECISRIKRLELRWNGEALTIYPDEILQEETLIMEDGSKRIVDLMVNFSKAEPAIYVEKWEGKLAIEIYDTHKIGNKKIKQMKQKGIAVFEFNVSKWNIRDEFKNIDDEEMQITEKVEKLDGENDGYIRGALLVDPISRKYFSTVLYENEKNEKERIKTELEHLQYMYEQSLINNEKLKYQLKELEGSNALYKNKINDVSSRLQIIEKENRKIKSTLWYKIFGNKRLR